MKSGLRNVTYNYFYKTDVGYVDYSDSIGTGNLYESNTTTIFASSTFGHIDSFKLDASSPVIDKGNPVTAMYDDATPPGLGNDTNDMGVFGGPFNVPQAYANDSCDACLEAGGHEMGVWRFTESSGDTTRDSTSNDNDGGITGATFTDFSIANNALSFDGDSDYVTIADDASLDIGGSMTFAGWFQFDDGREGGGSSNDQVIVGKWQTSGSQRSFNIQKSNTGKLQLIISDDGSTSTSGHYAYLTTDTLLPNGPTEWHHLAFVYNNCDPGMTIYKDAVDMAGSISYTLPTSIYNSTAPLVLGDLTVGQGLYLKGTMDEVNLFSGALSQTKVQALYDAHKADIPDLKAHWKLNGASSGTAIDSSGYELDGTITGATYIEGGRYDSALSFDGSGDYFEIPDNELLSFTSSFTFAGWFKFNDGRPADYRALVGKWISGGSQRSYLIELQPNGTFAFLMSSDGTGNVGAYSYLVTDTALANGATDSMHLAFVYDASTPDLTIYKNAVDMEGSITYTLQSSVHDGTASTVLGNYKVGGTYDFDGWMDDVRFYGKALSSTEVSNLYNNGAPKRISDFMAKGKLPQKFEVYENIPNPFNPTTQIRFAVPSRMVEGGGFHQFKTIVEVRTISGQLVKRLTDSERGPGRYSVTWHGRDHLGKSVSSGVYITTVKVGNQVKHRKMILLK